MLPIGSVAIETKFSKSNCCTAGYICGKRCGPEALSLVSVMITPGPLNAETLHCAAHGHEYFSQRPCDVEHTLMSKVTDMMHPMYVSQR